MLLIHPLIRVIVFMVTQSSIVVSVRMTSTQRLLPGYTKDPNTFLKAASLAFPQASLVGERHLCYWPWLSLSHALLSITDFVVSARTKLSTWVYTCTLFGVSLT